MYQIIVLSSLIFLIPASCCADDFSGSAAKQESILAPGYGVLRFPVPKVGSYQLPVLGQAGDGLVIDSHGVEYSLSQLMRNQVVVLSFIYSTCSDVNGCPLATSVLHRVKNRMNKEPQLFDRTRLLTMSFNPEFDTPEVMKHYAEGLQEDGLDWRFLTTRSEAQLQPILEKYQQTRQKEYDDKGQFSGTYSHILRVFLIDQQGVIRNIYSVSFLHPDTLINDIKTLLLEQSDQTTARVDLDNNGILQTKQKKIKLLYRAGDNKTDYEQGEYTTQSIALSDRIGQTINLLQYIKQPPLGLGSVPVPLDNPPTAEKIQLGRKLFYDRRLSLNNTISCAMCHLPEQGFTSNETIKSVGIEGRTAKRNAPTLYNVAYSRLLFHDGRENTLEQQVWGPLLADKEMANPSVAYVIDKINNNDNYVDLFKKAFKRGPSMETVGMAIASYERSLNSANSAFDRWYYNQDGQAISEEAKSGFDLFQGKAGCENCHQVGNDAALFMDNKLHNTGVGYQQAMVPESGTRRIQLAPGQFIEVNAEMIRAITEQKQNDLGRYEITQMPKDRWAYKTPSLRNVSLTAPYMHNGSISSLKQVIEFYNQGGVANENIDPLIKPLNLSRTEMENLVAFLKTLTGDNVAQLVADAFAAPIGDIR